MLRETHLSQHSFIHSYSQQKLFTVFGTKKAYSKVCDMNFIQELIVHSKEKKYLGMIRT